MMKVKHLLAASAIILLSSCSTVKKTSDTAAVNAQVATFTVADMEISTQKASLTYNWSYNPFKQISIETIKENTTAELLQQQNGDVLVEPQYIVNKRGLWRGGSVTVIGYPAKFTGFHKMTEDEARILRDTQNVKVKEKGKKRFIIF